MLYLPSDDAASIYRVNVHSRLLVAKKDVAGIDFCKMLLFEHSEIY